MAAVKKYIKKVIVNDTKSSTESRAERLRRVRNMANLSREEMCDNEGLNINTFKGWEIARYGGLPVDGAEKIIVRVAKEGVICTADWLLHGTGIGPYVVPEYQRLPHNAQQDLTHGLNSEDEKQRIYKEIALFKELFSCGISHEIEDDGLAPLYKSGDFVAGISMYQENINNLFGKICIVQTETGLVLTRYLQKGETPGSYTLLCSNMKTSVQKPTLYDVKLISAATVIRHYQAA